jgi:hypothetical protein
LAPWVWSKAGSRSKIDSIAYDLVDAKATATREFSRMTLGTSRFGVSSLDVEPIDPIHHITNRQWVFKIDVDRWFLLIANGFGCASFTWALSVECEANCAIRRPDVFPRPVPVLALELNHIRQVCKVWNPQLV